MNSIIAFILSLPEFIKLVRQILKHYEEHRRAHKLKSDMAELADAYANRDGDRIARVFNNANKKTVPPKDS